MKQPVFGDASAVGAAQARGMRRALYCREHKLPHHLNVKTNVRRKVAETSGDGRSKRQPTAGQGRDFRGDESFTASGEGLYLGSSLPYEPGGWAMPLTGLCIRHCLKGVYGAAPSYCDAYATLCTLRDALVEEECSPSAAEEGARAVATIRVVNATSVSTRV